MINVKKMLLRGGRSILEGSSRGGRRIFEAQGRGGEVSLKVEFKIPEEDFSNIIAWSLSWKLKKYIMV